MQSVISVQNLSKQYGSFQAVNDLWFTVEQGDIYGFLGQNGAGKSTTIRMLLTLIAPTAGDIFLFDKKLQTHRTEILKNVGAVIEKPDLYKYLSAYDNLSIFAKMSGMAASRNQLMAQLDMVGLADRAKDKVAAYSLGMKQRLGIAVALVHNPALVILDEPTNGLDPQGIADMRQLIIRLSKEMGKTVLISSHLLSEVEMIATRMMVIHKGKKVVEGKVSELLDPAHTLVEIETTDIAVAKSKISLSPWGSYLQPHHDIQLMMNKAEVPALIQALVAMDIPLLAVNSSHSLENYFLSLTSSVGYVDAVAN
jgi:ABC-type multidrug transport system ATPase subunit